MGRARGAAIGLESASVEFTYAQQRPDWLLQCRRKDGIRHLGELRIERPEFGGGAEFLTQGLDYFINPPTKSFVLSFSLSR